MLRFLLTSRRVAVAGGISLGLLAQHASALFFVVNQPWVRPAQRTQVTAVYMNLTSRDGATLVSAASAVAGSVAIRAPGKAAGTLARLPLPAQSVVALAPGGYHLVLSGLVRTLKLGDRVPLTLTIESADGSREDISVNAEVRLRSPIDDEMRAHKHAHQGS